jgi:hypothetical protein
MEATTMKAVEIQAQARALFEAHGPKALAEAAEKARSCEAAGDKQLAEDWKQIANALRNLKDPIAS